MVSGLHRLYFLLLTINGLWKIHGVRAASNSRTIRFALDNHTACGNSMVLELRRLYSWLLTAYGL